MQATPFLEKRTIVDGFDIHVYWDNVRNKFVGTMLFSPSWGHSHGIVGSDSKDKFFDSLVYEIEDAKKIFTNGGKYPDDYYNRTIKNK